MSPASKEKNGPKNDGIRRHTKQLVVAEKPSFPDKKKGKRPSERFAELASSIHHQLSKILREHKLLPLVTRVSAVPYGLAILVDFDQETRLAAALHIPPTHPRNLTLSLFPSDEGLATQCLMAMIELARQTDCADVLIKTEITLSSTRLSELGFTQIIESRDMGDVQYWQLPIAK